MGCECNGQSTELLPLRVEGIPETSETQRTVGKDLPQEKGRMKNDETEIQSEGHRYRVRDRARQRGNHIHDRLTDSSCIGTDHSSLERLCDSPNPVTVFREEIAS